MRAEFFAWFAELERDQQVFGIGDFTFSNNPELVKQGWVKWHNSGYKHKPNKDEVALRDPDWDSDLDLVEMMYRMKTNNSLHMMVFRQRGDQGGEIIGRKQVLPSDSTPPENTL